MNSSSSTILKWQPCVERLLIAFSIFITFASVKADPRDTLAPWPEETLAVWGFDPWYAPMTPPPTIVGLDSAQFRESWTGYSLVRDGLTFTPVAIPVTDGSTTGRTNFTTKVGSIRFWFSSDWSSGSFQSQGTNTYPRLLELVSLYGNTPETLLALYFNPERTAIYLSGQGVSGPTDFLSVGINWQAGEWHLLTLAYDEQQTSLFVDTNLVATGAAIPDVAAWKQTSLALAVGSDISGGNQAQGQFDELSTFDHTLNQNDLAPYWKCFHGITLLGPLGTPEEEEHKQEQLRVLTRTFGRMSALADGPDLPPEGEDPPVEEGPLPPTNSIVSYPSNALWLSIEAVSNATAFVTIHGTVEDTMYELLSRENLTTNAAWQSEGTWLGLSNATPATVTVGVRTNKLFLWARSYQDTDGSGMPDWWQIQYFGHTGVDGYADPDGDGWVNLQEYQNRSNPNAFNTPAAPQNFTVTLGTNGSSALLKWQPAGGNVTGYTIERSFDSQTIQVSAATTSFTDNSSLLPSGLFWVSGIPSYRIQAQYSGGGSDFSAWLSDQRSFAPEASFVSRSGNDAVTIVQSVPLAATALRVGYWRQTYGQPPISVAYWDFPAANITNNMVVWNSTMVSTNGTGRYARWISTNNVLSGAQEQSQQVPQTFWDGRTALLENLRFLLRAANSQLPFNYVAADTDPENWPTTNFTSYAYAGIHRFELFSDEPTAFIDEFKPFRFNYAYRNFVFKELDADPTGFLDTGVNLWSENNLSLDYPPLYEFSPPSSPANIPTMLATNDTRWTYFIPESTDQDLGLIGIGITGGNWILTNNARNLFGLPYLSAKFATDSGSGPAVTNLLAGATMPTNIGYFYPETQQPVLQNAGYYFCVPYVDLFPGHRAFSPTNQTPIIIASVGDPEFQVAGYAKLAIANGYTNKFAYLGQYFDKAYKANTNGTRSTNETGLLSPYGQFFPTELGKTFLTTKPDGVSTNIGECIVNVIKLQLDVNHDGVMDPSWTGPDNTSDAKPFVFWVNDDHDELAGEGKPDRDTYDPSHPNCRNEAIACPRDLEDFARLWIEGIPSLPLVGDHIVKLSWLGETGAINIFNSCETNGGTLYLTDTNVAAQQCAFDIWSGIPVTFGHRLAVISNGASYTFPAGAFSLPTTPHLLFEGCAEGKGQLVLTISRIESQTTNIVAQTSAWLDLRKVWRMYERAAITNVERYWPWMAEQTLSSGFKILSAPNTVPETKELAVFVHGWRLTPQTYDNFSETMFKRLYWQGFQGRFAAPFWPTRSPATELIPGAEFLTFNRSEHIALESGTGMAAYLQDLRSRYPDYTISACSHSQGADVMVEALRQLATANQRPIDNYVIMQGAFPAQVFDTAVTNFPAFVQVEQSVPTPNTYHGYGTNITGGLRNDGRIVNFFNPIDFALAASPGAPLTAGGWELNQIYYGSTTNGVITMKPNTYLGYYTDGTNSILRTNHFNQSPLFAIPLLNGIYSGPMRAVTNSHELMAFVSRARTKAVGTLSGVGGVITTNGEFNLNAQFGFSHDWSDHSGQFNRNIQESPLQLFYPNLLEQLFFKEP